MRVWVHTCVFQSILQRLDLQCLLQNAVRLMIVLAFHFDLMIFSIKDKPAFLLVLLHLSELGELHRLKNERDY